MSARVQRLRAQLFDTGRQIEAAVKSDFPIGARVRWSTGVNNRIGRVVSHGGFLQTTRLRVRAERTNNLVDVPMCFLPEVLSEPKR